MKNIILPLCFILCSVISRAQPTTIRIDPAAASSGTASQLFDEIKYIPLETTKESLFGDILTLTVVKKYFIIEDYYTNSILLFSKTGKFHAKIAGKKLTINNLRYLKDGNRLLVVFTKPFTPEIQDKINKIKNQEEGQKLFRQLATARFYDLNGNQLPEPVPESYFSDPSIELFPGTTASISYEANENFPDSTAYQLNIYKNNQLHKSWFPYNTKKDILMCGEQSNSRIYKSKTDSIFYYTRSFDYTIYKLTEDTLIAAWKFIFPLQNTVPKSLYNDSTSTKEELKVILKKNPAWITTLDNIHVFNDLLLFRAVNNERNFDQSNNFIYNLKSGSLISLSKSTPDKKNGYLPFLGNSFSYQNFKAQKGSYLYTSVSSLEMFQAKEKSADKNPIYPHVMQNYFKTENRKSNPVIVQLKPKENL